MHQYITTLSTPWIIVMVISFIVVVLTIGRIVFRAAESARYDSSKKLGIRTILFFIIYLIYVTILCLSGAFNKNTLPPVIFICATIPLLLFFFLVVKRSELYKKLLSATSFENLIAYHIIRFVGFFFLLGSVNHILPEYFAFIAGWGDIVTAIFALILVFTLKGLKGKTKVWIIIIWNFIGALDILNVIITANVLTYHAIESGSHGLLGLLRFPYVFIPALAPATILFSHFVIFQKLYLEKKQLKH